MQFRDNIRSYIIPRALLGFAVFFEFHIGVFGEVFERNLDICALEWQELL